MKKEILSFVQQYSLDITTNVLLSLYTAGQLQGISKGTNPIKKKKKKLSFSLSRQPTA